MCKKSIYKKNFLLCTIAGTLIFSHCGSTYANTQVPIMVMARADKAGEEKTFNNVFVRGRFTTVVADEKSFITIKNSMLRSDSTLISASQGAGVHAQKILGKAGTRGLEIANGTIHLEDSVIIVAGQHKSYGIRFDHIPDSHVKEGEKVINKVILTNTKLLMTEGIGIAGPYSSKSVAEVYLQNSEIRSEMLLKNKSVEEDKKPKTLTLTADASIIEGKVKTFPQNTTIFTLNNGSKWHLKTSLFEGADREDVGEPISYTLIDIKQRARSVVSVLNLNNSSIVFHAPHALEKGQYHTLHVGKHSQAVESTSQEESRPAITTVYNATGHANIYFNVEWSDGLIKEKQKADRLLVHGNVSGTTIIHVNNLAQGEPIEAEDSTPLNERGLSLIQVSGKADEHAFRLANGYTTMEGLPYKYVLNAYGPTSSRGKADSSQSYLGELSQELKENAAKNNTKYRVLGDLVVEIERDTKGATISNQSKKDFWDFRLQKETLDDEGKILALVPQVASYLVMPNALFSAGFA
ncbi:autotransporter outer membrane beta-barrel domain-containing protein, partial [Bartonella pachyuromydis]|uniref:autotransporter outer membrane beta-barrel domain-containing protein n=1 Tax=Bartonella pachyuromydis TaxID=931097 RepID=UPI0031EE4A10